MHSLLLILFPLVGYTQAQQIGTNTAEVHPALTWQTCTAPGSCTTVNGKIVLDSNWRWLHSSTGTNCYTGNTWDATLCPSNTACAANCQLDGANYASTYGITTTGNSLRLNFVTSSSTKNIGSRVYLMADDDNYKTFNMLNQELAFDVDVSHLPCGINGALYFAGMQADGGKAAYTGNKAGARYGVGYCDAQCPRDLKFINGLANSEGWIPASNSVNTGVGNHGSCCAEMDVWEANSISTAYTPHTATGALQNMCTGDSCGGTYSNDRYGGTTDPDGCDFNSYRMGDKSFYGPGLKVNTNSVFTVVTQFITNTGTSSGSLQEIKRFYVQNGVVIPNSVSTVAGVSGNSITDTFCDAQKTAFGDSNGFKTHGGLANMGDAFKAGMVLVLSIWDDYAASLLWLDSTYPVTGDPAKPGNARGTCSTASGVPADVEAQSPNSYVVYSNIKTGPFNSTFAGGSAPVVSSSSTILVTSTKKSTSTSAGTTTTAAPGGTIAHYGQCGGVNWTGATACVSPWTCAKQNDFFSQCL